MTILLGLIGGLGIAIGLAFFVNYLDDSIKSQDDVETYLRLPFLGYVPNIKTNSVVERDLQAHLHPQSNAAEGFRTLRASISLTPKVGAIPRPGRDQHDSVGGQIAGRVQPGDRDGANRAENAPGRRGPAPTLCAQGLPAAQPYRSCPRILTNEIDQLEPIVHKTEVPNLDVICCGAVPATPSELIGSKRMMDFLQAARGRYDRIVLDSPPISAVSDPLDHWRRCRTAWSS